MDDIMVYRLESVCCLLSSFKLYLIWRVIRDRMLRGHPKRRIVSRFTYVDFNSMFAFKEIFNSHGLKGVGIVWLSSLIVLG